MRRNQNFEFFFEKVSLPPRLLPFAFSPLRFFCFSFPVFFFCWAFTRLAFGGKRFCKKFEDCEFFLKEVRVGKWVKIFIGIFCSKFHGFLDLSLVCMTKSRSSGYGLKDLISLHKLVVKVV